MNMKVYDAKTEQICRLCGFKLPHNKQGRFTSHLIIEHQLTLNEYLVQYFYSKEEVTCKYELCSNIVSLRRGIPNEFCSRKCRGKGPPLVCVVCRTKFDEKNRSTKTCSKECAKKLRSANTNKWHKNMPLAEKEKHFRNIITKTAKTRKLNKTPSWNSGKTGIYSEETIAKIRKAALEQLQRETFRKTSIEKKIEQFLIEQNINYQYSFIFKDFQYDFYLPESKILIECDGDFYHANPKFYPDEMKLYDIQKRIKEKDKIKSQIAFDSGFILLRFWEDDINNNLDSVKNSINNALLATT